MLKHRTLDWFMPDARDTVRSWDDSIKSRVGDQLRQLQFGEIALRRKGWKGKGWSGFELSIDAFRVVGTLEDQEKVTVLHCFRKDAKRGKKTRQADVDKVEERHKLWKAQFFAVQQKAGQVRQKKGGSRAH